MRNTGTAILIVLLGAGLGGCAARYAEKGDAAMLAGNHEQALQLYRKALDKDARYARKPEFVGKLREAEVRVLEDEGRQLATAGQWTDAVAKLGEAVRLAPEDAAAAAALADTKRGASRAYYRHAIEMADQGKLDDAVRLLKEALELDPANAEAAEALDSVSAVRGEQQGRAGELVAQGRDLQAQRRWRQAAELHRRAIALTPTNVRARVELHRCEQELAAAAAHYRCGVALRDEKRLEQAREALEQALSIWPFFADARRDLEQVTTLLADAARMFAEAQGHAAAGEWEPAVASLSGSLAMYPYDEAARALLEESLDQAALARVREGEALLAAGKFDSAEAAFNRAFGFRPGFLQAEEGLGAVWGARGARASAQGRWGAALVNYTEANRHRLGRDDGRVQQALAKVLAEARFSLAVDLNGVETLTRQALMNNMRASRPEAITAIRQGGVGDIHADVRSLGTNISTHLAGREERTQTYIVQRRVVNPEIARLTRDLEDARGEQQDLRRRLQERCNACDGTGQRVCQVCGGDRYWHKDPSQPCGHCHATGVVSCPFCDGRGRGGSISRSEIDDCDARIDDLIRELRFAPRTVLRDFEETWVYTVERYERTGDARLTVALSGAGFREFGFDVSDSHASSDTTISNANPSIGVYEDPLDLESDETVRNMLAGGLAGRAAPAIINAAVRARLVELESAADAFVQAGRDAEALEKRAQRAVLLRCLDGTAGDAALAGLTAQAAR